MCVAVVIKSGNVMRNLCAPRSMQYKNCEWSQAKRIDKGLTKGSMANGDVTCLQSVKEHLSLTYNLTDP